MEADILLFKKRPKTKTFLDGEKSCQVQRLRLEDKERKVTKSGTAHKLLSRLIKMNFCVDRGKSQISGHSLLVIMELVVGFSHL